MSFAPLTTVRLLSGVPFDKYNTINFASKSDQLSFMESKTRHVAVDLTYQREQRQIAYPAVYDDVIGCNYVAYQNPAFSDKWFYGYITNVEYINESNTYVYFDIDPWQTFLFDIQFKSCFVEREHVSDDSVGAHLIDEGLSVGDYISVATTETNFSRWWIVVGSTVDLQDLNEFAPVGGYTYGGIYSGASYYLFDPDDVFILEEIITNLATAGKLDAVITMYMVPKSIVEEGSSGGFLPADPMSPRTMYPPNTNSLDGYTPRNNKLLTYPFRCLQVSNNDGNAVILRYEFFRGNIPTMEFVGTSTPNGRIIAYPQNYRGVSRNFNESVALGNYPQCTWVKDVYSNWLASQSIRWGYQKDRLIFNSMTGLAAGGAGALTTGSAFALAGPATSMFSDSYNLASAMREEKEVHSIIPNAIGGSVGNSYTNVTFNKYAFTCEQKTIKAELARSIDGYFDMFGYKVNIVKTPDITTRPSWNYVKTNNAKIVGECPQPFLEDMKNDMNHGMTFWHGDYIGDYSRNNGGTPVPPPENTYRLDVINGSGSGTYKGGESVQVIANTVAGFKYWTSANGGSFYDSGLSTTYFTMPFNDCTITAVYEVIPTKTRIDEVFRKYIGAVEWDATVGTFQRWYYGSYIKAAWCTTSLTYCANEANLGSQVPKNENVQALFNFMNARSKTWPAEVGGRLPNPGDILFFITSQSSTVLHHCGVVSAVNGTKITYISGNTTNPTSGRPDGVFEKTTTIGQGGSYYVKYFGEVDYT